MCRKRSSDLRWKLDGYISWCREPYWRTSSDSHPLIRVQLPRCARRLWNNTRAKMVTEMQAVRDLCKGLDAFRRPPGHQAAADTASSSSSDSDGDEPVSSSPPAARAVKPVRGYMQSKAARRGGAGGGGANVQTPAASGTKKKAAAERGRGKHADKPKYSETLAGDAVDKELCELIEREIVEFDAHVRWDDIAELTDAKRLLEEVGIR